MPRYSMAKKGLIDQWLPGHQWNLLGGLGVQVKQLNRAQSEFTTSLLAGLPSRREILVTAVAEDVV